MATQAAQGKKLIAESKYAEAIELFTLALAASPTSPDYLIQRSTAYQRSKQYSEALKDAEAAIIHATTRAKRELIIQGQLRRGIALYNLGQYADAKLILGIVKSKDPNDKAVDMWLNLTEGKMKMLGNGDEKSKITVSEMPDASAVDAAKSGVGSAMTAPASAAHATPAEKIRHEWYQTSNSIFLTLLAKGVPEDKTHIEINDGSVSISFPIEATGSDYDFTIDPLFAHIEPSKSSFRILPSKVEITLAKATSGQKWSAIEGTEALPERISNLDTNQPQPKAPAYPTSSKTGPKDWDKLAAAEIKADDEDDGGDGAMKFFKQLYKDASPETQRAMMKSYSESNGTALSTDWSEVSKKKVDTLPPDGMVAKKWEM